MPISIRTIPNSWKTAALLQPEHDKIFPTKFPESPIPIGFTREHMEEMTLFSIIIQTGYALPHVDGTPPMPLAQQGKRARRIIKGQL